jgi:hypothetical protein
MLCNSETSYQSEELTFEAAKQLVDKVPQNEKEFWFAWQTGWEDWKAILDVEEFKAPVAPPQNYAKPPPLPPKRHTAESAKPILGELKMAFQEETKKSASAAKNAPKPADEKLDLPLNDRRDEERTDGSERRRFPRYDVRLRCIIRNDVMTFRTFTRDISLSGVSLENPIPEHLLQKPCHIFIAGPDGKENIKFSLAMTSRADRRYFSFAGMEQAFTDKLGAWLKNQSGKIAPKKRVG